MSTAVPVRRFSVAEYHQLIASGFFANDDRYELLDGWITPKMVRNPPHDSFLDQVEEILRVHLPAGWRIRVQSAITLSTSEPEPDLAIVPGPASRYRTAHPGPAEVALVVEVADSTLDRDRALKGPIYAHDHIPIYWIINIVDMCIEIYTAPTGPTVAPTYQHTRVVRLGDTVDVILHGQTVVTLPVVDFLG
jgi:hypothetical protein